MARKLLKTNFSAGEISPRLDGRPDLAKYYNGAAIMENNLIFPEGGFTRRPGLRMIAEVKNSAKQTRLIPFVFSRPQAYVVEAGEIYFRFFKNTAPVLLAGVPYEVVSPFAESQLFDLQWEQSADVKYLDHQDMEPRKLERVSDTNWTVEKLVRRPPPSVEDNTDIGTPAGATLTPGATAGTNIAFNASAACFLNGDKDRQIVYGSSRAVIRVVDSVTQVHADILDSFPNTSAIPAGQWFIDKSPSSYLNPNKQTQLGGTITLDAETNTGAGQDTFRAADVGKFIKILGGLVEITQVVTIRQVLGVVRVALKTDKPNPDPVPGGDWTMEVEAWDVPHGFPRAPFFYQGRLGHAGWPSQPGTTILSASDDFENYGVGSHADSAVEFTIVRQQAGIVWGADLGDLFIATPEAVFAAKGPGVDQPLGGDVIPYVRRQHAPGAMAVQPITPGRTAIYPDSSTKRVHELTYDFDTNAFRALDITRLAQHITGDSGLKQEQIAWWETPNRHLFFLRKDGVIAACTYYRVPEDVTAWSRIVTARTVAGAGVIESQCVIPHPDGDRDQVWCIVKRVINGATKRFIEVFEDSAPELEGGVRPWTQLNTDCAKVYSGAAVTNVPAGFLNHLIGETVDVIANGMYKGTRVVTAGGVFNTALPEAATTIEAGLHYDSTCTTMRPASQDGGLEGTKKVWSDVSVRLLNSIGGSIKTSGKEFQIQANIGGQPMDQPPPLFTGDKEVPLNGIDDEGRITIYQRLPLPQTILCVYGHLNPTEVRMS